MARLTAAQRDALPASAFAGPDRSFPINDENHARAALSMVGRAHGLSAKQRLKIKSRARSKLGLRRRTEP